MYVTIVWYLLGSVGGVDLAVYEANSNLALQEWSYYYYKEFFSWGIIKLAYRVSGYFGLSQPALVINLFLLVIYFLFTRGMNLRVKLIPLILLSPIAILLSLNVLRQYISILLLCLATLSLLDKRYIAACLLIFLSFFSHQSVILLIFCIFAIRFLSFRSVALLVLSMQLFIFVLNSYGFSFYSGEGYVEVGDVSTASKVLFYFAYLVVLFLALNSLGVGVGDELYFIKVIKVLLWFAILMIAFPWPSWIANRYLISVGFIYLFLIFSRVVVSEKVFLILLLVLIFNLLGVYFHGGARSMVVLS
jgi:hypothetical protein